MSGGAQVNGALTAGENVADLAGVKFAYAALAGEIGPGQLSQVGRDGWTRAQRSRRRLLPRGHGPT